MGQQLRDSLALQGNMMQESSDILDQINAKKKAHVEACKQHTSEPMLWAHIKTLPPTKPFAGKLSEKVKKQEIGLIAEIKKASPSKGIIREDFNPATLVADYESSGATCISVLTDQPYFQGSDEDLKTVRAHTSLPILRKDFIVDGYQIIESRALGADAILLIMASLPLAQAKELEKIAIDLGLSVLIEVHNKQELERALQLKSPLIGINNRNLKTLSVDLSTTASLLPFIPEGYTVVCESGLSTHQDIANMNAKGVWAFLVGESLMRQEDVRHATKTLLGKIS
jgi:indole-3-glycerol phosphate synthase